MGRTPPREGPVPAAPPAAVVVVVAVVLRPAASVGNIDAELLISGKTSDGAEAGALTCSRKDEAALRLCRVG